MLITIYVDDILMASYDNKWLEQINKSLSQSFEMKDIGPVKTCLCINFQQNLLKHQIFLHQTSYNESILAKFNMENCEPNMPDEAEMKKNSYQDIVFTEIFLSQFNSNYSIEHWKAIERIL